VPLAFALRTPARTRSRMIFVLHLRDGSEQVQHERPAMTVVYSIAMDAEYSDRLLAKTRTAVSGANNPQAVLHAAYEAIVQGNFEAFGETVTEDVELNICGFGALDGAWRGRSDVVEATRRNFALIGVQQPEIESIIRQGDCVAVLLRESGVFRSTGQAYSIRAVQWFTFAEGKIKRIDETVASIWKVTS
jgi:ketosteroid isomerase-like protein